MENQKSPISASLTYGLLLGLALIVFSLIMFILNVGQHSKIQWISYLIMIGGLFWAMIAYRNKYSDGFISYGKAFGVGFWTILFAAIIASIYTYFYVTRIDPALIENILSDAEDKILANSPDISDEDLENALHYTRMFTSPFMITIWGFIANVIFGTILSMIIAIFVKREKKPEITDTETQEA